MSCRIDSAIHGYNTPMQSHSPALFNPLTAPLTGVSQSRIYQGEGRTVGVRASYRF